MDDYKQLIQKRILAQETFVRAVFSGQQKGLSVQWIKVTVRPVEIKGKFNWQFSYFDEKKDITRNYSLADAANQVNELLVLPFKNIFVESGAGNVQVNFSKKGRALVSKSKPSTADTDLSHDRYKDRLLTPENAAPFLKTIGILTQDGRIKADMQRKYQHFDQMVL